MAPPIVLPSYPVLSLSPMFDPRCFFLLEEILPSRKRACSRSSSSTFALPKVFEIRESSYKKSLERHEEQIETILNHLDELPLERIEHMEEKIKQIRLDDEIVLDHVRTSTLEILIKDIQNGSQEDINIYKPAMTQAAIRKLVADSVAVALEAQAATMANTNNTNSNRTKDCKVKFATGTLTEEALTWWNSFAQPIGMRKPTRSRGNDLKTYIRRFQELAVLCPTMVPNSKKLMEVFIEGLPRRIKGNVTTSKPQTFEEAITITQRLMDQKLVPKGKQQCPWKSILAERQERSPRSERSHGYVPSKSTSSKSII
nr:reverse transcriptase domain-containing protein [Tanacetum cinerariifolium]